MFRSFPIQLGRLECTVDCAGVHRIASVRLDPCVSSSEAMHHVVASVHAPCVPKNGAGRHHCTSGLSPGSHCRSLHNVGNAEDSVRAGAVVGHDDVISPDPDVEASSLKHSSFHDSTVCSSQSWVIVESEGEASSVGKTRPKSEIQGANMSAAECSNFCSKGFCALPHGLCHMRLTREKLQHLSREEYMQHVHGKGLSSIVDQILIASPFSRFVPATRPLRSQSVLCCFMLACRASHLF